MSKSPMVFATNNLHKLEEIQAILGDAQPVVSLKQIGCNEDIEETASTFEGNALLKARYVHAKYGCDCFADDSGLEVDALGGEPGVYSARYAGADGHDSEANMDKLLQKLSGIKNRHARFRTVIALIWKGKEYLFDGKVEGVILEEKRGEKGFGYDPLFVPDGYEQTFAQMESGVKNKISHRARAMEKLVLFLTQ